MRRQHGFTLIELLVVVAVISILIAIMMPSLARAREQSKALKCLNILRQFSIASQMYADQNNDWFVPAQRPIPNTSEPWYANAEWRRMLNLQTNVRTLPSSFVCSNATYTWANPDNATGEYMVATTYGMNVHTLLNNGTTGFIGYKRSIVLAPSSRIFFADSNDWWITMGGSSYYTGDERVAGPGYYAASAYRHQNRANVAFFDGHAEPVLRKNMDRNLAGRDLSGEIWDARQ